VVDSPRAKVKIEDSNGNLTDYSDRIMDVSVDDTDRDVITQFDLELSNSDGALNHLQSLDEVEIGFSKDGSSFTTILRGLISSPSQSVDNSGSSIEINGGDFGKILQRSTVADAFINQKLSEIVKEVVDKEVNSGRPSYQQISYNNVQDFGLEIDRAIAPAESAFDFFKRLTRQVQKEVVFYVDKNKDLHLEERGTQSSGLTFERGKNISEASFSKTDDENLVNFAVVYGHSKKTGEAKQVTADGTRQTVDLDHKPKDTRVINKTAGTTLSGGIKGVDTLSETDVEYLVDFHNKQVIINEPNGDDIEIQFEKGNPVFAFSRNISSINDPNIGEAQDQFMLEWIETKEVAENVADKIVNRFAFPLTKGDITVDGVVGIQAGETARIKLPNQNIDEELVMARVGYKLDNSMGLVQEIEVNEKFTKVEDYVKSLEERIKGLEARQSGRLDVIPQIEFFGDVAKVDDFGEVEIKDLEDSFILGSTILGDAHTFQTGTDTQTEKGFDRGTLTGDATISGDKVTLSTDNSSGRWTVQLPYNGVGQGNNSWETLTYSTNKPTNTDVTVNVLAADGTTLASNVSNGANIGSVAGTYAENIKLEVVLESTSTSGNVPELTSIIQNFQPDKLGDQSSPPATHDTF